LDAMDGVQKASFVFESSRCVDPRKDHHSIWEQKIRGPR
jgi:hypothetical protein